MRNTLPTSPCAKWVTNLLIFERAEKIALTDAHTDGLSAS